MNIVSVAPFYSAWNMPPAIHPPLLAALAVFEMKAFVMLAWCEA
jgi:hypothetical protein